jgi:hypothetical protein
MFSFENQTLSNANPDIIKTLMEKYYKVKLWDDPVITKRSLKLYN